MLDEAAMNSSIVTYDFKHTSSGPLKLDLHRCPDSARGCALFIHGGALLLGSRNDLTQPVITLLHSMGLHVASLDYRLAPEHSIAEIFSDIQDGCRYIKNVFTDMPLFTIGYSAGAYLALLNGARGEPVDGVLAFAGYGDLAAAWYYEPSQFFIDYKNVPQVESKIERGEAIETLEERIDLYVYLRQTGTWPVFVLGKESLAETARTYSPEQFLSASYPPTVLVHGSADCDVPASASQSMAAGLKRVGATFVHLELAGFDHDLFVQLDKPSVLDAWQEAISFLCKNSIAAVNQIECVDCL